MSKPRQKFDYPCPACHTKNEVKVFVKPTSLTPSISKLVCGRCDCQFIIKVEKKKGLDACQVLITPKLTFISEDGKRFIRAQEILREQKAKEKADANASTSKATTPVQQMDELQEGPSQVSAPANEKEITQPVRKVDPTLKVPVLLPIVTA